MRKRGKASSLWLWIIVAVCLLFLAGMYAGQAIKKPVERQVIVSVPVPVPTPPVVIVAKRAKATLAQVRKDWGIDGPLSCDVRDYRGK